MATLDDVRTIANSLPSTSEGSGDRFSFSVENKGKHKGFLWTWAERVHPKKPKVINNGVIAVVVPNLNAKDMIIASNPEVYFTEDHYNGYSAVLVRLEVISVEDVRPLILEAWKCKAPQVLVAEVFGPTNESPLNLIPGKIAGNAAYHRQKGKSGLKSKA